MSESLIIIEPRQTLIDVAIQSTGSVDAVFELAELNDISITDDLVPGSSLIVPGTYKKAIQHYYSSKEIRPATGLNQVAIEILNNTNEDTMKTIFLQKDSRTAIEMTPSNEYEVQLLNEFFDEHLESKYKSRFRFEYDQENNKALFYFESTINQSNLFKAGYEEGGNMGIVKKLNNSNLTIHIDTNGGMYIIALVDNDTNYNIVTTFEEGTLKNMHELGLKEKEAHKYA